MQLFIKGLDGETFTVETSLATVDDVKKQIEEIEGIPVSMQRLIFEGKELELGRSIEYYKVRHDSTLHVSMDLDGGIAPWCMRMLAMWHVINKQICRKCYGRVSANAKRCPKAKCGRTTDIRPKKGLFSSDKRLFANFDLNSYAKTLPVIKPDS